MSFDWDAVWNRKGADDCLVHQEVSGFEHLTIDPIDTAKNLKKVLDLQADDMLLEVGCAVGIVARHLNHGSRYVGIDRSESMVKKMIALNGLSALRCDGDDLIFKDKSFDKSYSFAVFHYFPSHEYAVKVLDEMIRVTRKKVLIAYLPRKSHDNNHLWYDESLFTSRGFQISPSIYHHPDRFDVIYNM